MNMAANRGYSGGSKDNLLRGALDVVPEMRAVGSVGDLFDGRAPLVQAFRHLVPTVLEHSDELAGYGRR